MNSGIYVKEPFQADETNICLGYLENAGSNEQTVDGSVSPVLFSTPVVPSGKTCLITRLLIYMEDSSAFSSNLFGGIPELTNGWQLLINNVVIATAKNNRTLATFMYDLSGDAIFGKVNQTLVGRFSFHKFTDGASGVTIRAGETLSTRVQDDLSGLDHLNVMAQGVYRG